MRKAIKFRFIAVTLMAITISCTKNSTPDLTGMVDLGLSVKWASTNLGASKPEDFGGYYQWAGIENVSSIYINWDNCPYHNGMDNKTGWTKYIPAIRATYWSGPGNPDNKMTLDSSDDAAFVNSGGKLRMPTVGEWAELVSDCTWTWTDNYNGTGVAGQIVTGKKPGYTDKSIFLPAAGYRDEASSGRVGEEGFYWSAALDYGRPEYGCIKCFTSGGITDIFSCARCCGMSIRPVSK